MNLIGLYIHIPFCKQKCNYCDFISYTNKWEKIKNYIECLEKEIDKFDYRNYNVTTIYIGGGTPSYIDSKYIKQIMNSIYKKLQLEKNELKVVEITIEVNPGTVTEKKLLDYKNAGINSKSMKIKNKYSIYLKDGEEISKFLALIGANKAVMQFEDIRIQREMRGKVNRLVNCETANLNKTINASIEQIAAIRKLQETGKFNKLNDNLKEIAFLRLENPNIALVELGKLLKEPVGKSGVNYRLKKIIDIANE